MQKWAGYPARVSFTVAPLWKFLPVIVALTVASLPPKAGEIPGYDRRIS